MIHRVVVVLHRWTGLVMAAFLFVGAQAFAGLRVFGSYLTAQAFAPFKKELSA